MLREGLKDSDIPHRTELCDRIRKMLDIHLSMLHNDIMVIYVLYFIWKLVTK